MPDSEDEERKYSEDPKNTEEEAKELEEDLDELLSADDTFYSFRDALTSVNIEISSELGNINVRIFESADLNNVRESPIRSPLEAYSVLGDAIAEREEKVQPLLDENAAAPGDAAQKKKSDWNTARYLILFGVVTGSIAAIIYSQVARSASGQSDADIPLSEDLKAKIRQLVASWQGQSDAAFWGSMATYVQANKLTLADLVYFMQYTMDLNPLKAPFFWDHADDPDTLARGVEGLYKTGGGAALLKALPDLQYHGAGLPRYEQAFVGRTAFAELASKPGPSPVRKARAMPIVLHAEGGSIEDYAAAHAAAKSDGAVIPLAPSARQAGSTQLPRVAHLPLPTQLNLPLTLLPGETLKAHALVRLAAPWRGFNEGTALHLIHTSRAVLACPVAPRLARLGMASPLRIRPQVDAASTILQFSATAAFALPEPYGILLSGVISAVSSFFGGGGNDVAEAFKAAMKELLGEIQLALAIEDIQAAARTIEVSVNWLADHTQVIADLQGQDAASIEISLKDFLKDINGYLDPTTGIVSALTTLNDFISKPLPTSDAGLGGGTAWRMARLRESAFATLVTGVGVYLTWLRVRIQWQAALETQQAKDGKPKDGTLVYTYFDEFRIATKEWAINCEARLQDLYTDQKSFVHDWSEKHEEGGPRTANWFYRDFYLYDGWNGVRYQCTRVDEGDAQRHESDPERWPLPEPRCDFQYYTHNVLGPTFDGNHQPHRAMLRGFVDAVADWNKKIAAQKPSNAAVADPDLTKWGADAPQGNWVAGAKVRYAITNLNGAGKTTAGEWGDPVTIGTRAFALVSSIPVDTMGLTVTRQLRRQFTDPTGKAGPEQVVAIITNNTDTTYLDKTP